MRGMLLDTRLGCGLDDPGHDPAVLADLPIPDEPKPLVCRGRTIEEEARWHRCGVLGISLDGSPAEFRDQIERTGERRGGNALTAASLSDVATPDPPIWRGRSTLLVRSPVLDPGHLVGRPELAPADAILPVEDERGMGRSCPNTSELPTAVHARRVLGVVGVEAHAPASAEDPVVALDQRSERWPCRLVESPDLVPSFHDEAHSTVMVPLGGRPSGWCLSGGRRDNDPEVGELEPQAIRGLVVPLVDQSTEFVRERGPACG